MDEAVKVLFAANTPPDPTLGAPGCDLGTIAALRSLGHEIEDYWERDLPRIIKHHNLFQWIELPQRYAKLVQVKSNRNHFDVVQVNQPHAWLAAKQHRQQGRRGVFINRSHGWEPNVRLSLQAFATASDRRSSARKLFTRLLRIPLERHNQLALKWSDGIVLCSIDDFDYIQRHHSVDKDKLLVLNPGVDDLFFDSPTQKQLERMGNKLLYAGSFMPQKGPEVVASIMREVLGNKMDASATWICPESFHGSVRELLGENIVARVTLRHWMSKPELLSLFDSHDIFLFPSYFEGFAQTFLQAMARGMVVMASAIDGMRQTIVSGTDGFLFKPGDATGIARSCIEVIENPGLRLKVSRAAKSKSAKFTWGETANKLLQFWQQRIDAKLGTKGVF